MLRIELTALPDIADGKNYLYAAEFDDGIVKIGCCRSNLRQRAAAIYDAQMRKGRRMTSFFAHQTAVRRPFMAERQVMKDCGQICEPAFGKEWFRAPYMDVVKIVSDAAQAA